MQQLWNSTIFPRAFLNGEIVHFSQLFKEIFSSFKRLFSIGLRLILILWWLTATFTFGREETFYSNSREEKNGDEDIGEIILTFENEGDVALFAELLKISQIQRKSADKLQRRVHGQFDFMGKTSAKERRLVGGQHGQQTVSSEVFMGG